jgi:hypothetical protein
VESRIAEWFARRSQQCAQRRIVPSARLSAQSLCVKWRARRVSVMSSHAAMFVASLCAIGIANIQRVVQSQSVP